MSKIIKVTPNDDYTKQGNKMVFNMQELIKTLPFSSLSDLSRILPWRKRPSAGPNRYRAKKAYIPAHYGEQHAVYHTGINCTQ